MTESWDFEDHLAAGLDLIDRDLAADGVELKSRPLRAAREFVTFFISRISIGDVESKPGKFLDYAGSVWFKHIFARTVGWYSGRYGQAMEGSSGKVSVACLLILDTPFRMTVPLVTRRPGKMGEKVYETMWVCFPNEVEADEDALSWVSGGPNIHTLPRSDGLKARRLANEVAGLLRAIYTSLATISQPTDRVSELRAPILSHLDHAASLIASATPDSLRAAQWDLQMACELSLKMLAEQRAGGFAASHDLYHLYDKLPSGRMPFRRAALANMPHWERMAEWRYGGGQPVTIAAAFSRYRTTLKVVAGCAAAADRQLHVGGGRIELRRAPFHHDDPDMYLPREVLQARLTAPSD